MQKMKNLIHVLLLLLTFPFLGMAQENNDDDIADTISVDDIIDVDTVDYENMPLDSLVAKGIIDMENDPVYKSGMTNDEYEKALNEYTLNQIKTQLNGQEVPELTGDIVSDKAKIEDCFTKMFNNRRLRVETPSSVFMMMLQNVGAPKAQEEVNMWLPYLFQSTYSTAMEYAIYQGLGGKNDEIWQLCSAIMSGGVGDQFAQGYRSDPDTYSTRVDSIISFINRLDYLGDIYPNDKLRPREVQDSLVAECTKTLNNLKTGIYRQSKLNNFIIELMTQLYEGKDIVLENYFTSELCKKIRSKQVDLALISPFKEWKNWDAKNSCSFTPDGDGYIGIVLTEKTADEAYGQEFSSEEDMEKSTKIFEVKLDISDNSILISEILSQEEYFKKLGLDKVLPEME